MNKLYNPLDNGQGYGGAAYPGYTYPIWTGDRLAGHIRTNRIFYPRDIPIHDNGINFEFGGF